MGVLRTDPCLYSHSPSDRINLPLHQPKARGSVWRLALRATNEGQGQVHATQPNASASTGSSQPWTLMGRMVSPDRIQLSEEQRIALIASAAAQLSGADPAAFTEQVQELLLLLPSLRPRLASLQPALLAELAGNTAAVAGKMVQLREWFPSADLCALLGRHPGLLTEAGGWGGVREAHRKLHTMFPEGGVDEMVTRQPLLLVEDVDWVVGELERLLSSGGSSSGGSSSGSGSISSGTGATNTRQQQQPQQSGWCARLLRADPDLLLLVANNRKLSLW
ncbi:hypothetical protein Agub_g6791 [Astrephomene gubernaculifera]|uniref:Uncharacterized protein n=1 Tax=Astrephomene gubernaculifera TaxID=47775 RepID=A0AAD3DRL5_9CHLO|nr:hypothetical protein Agub_g6791 [Astrephomene gubernaculifera]